MRRVALKGLWWRRGRSALTTLAVVLGVAMVSGTFVLTDTIGKAFDEIFTGSYVNTSAVIAGREVVQESASGAATVPETLLAEVRENENVEEAAGAIFDLGGSANTVRLVDGDGKAIGSENSPKFGFGFDADAERFNPLSLTAGRWASGPGEVVLDKGSAEDAGVGVGDSVSAAARGPARPFRVTGIARYGSLNSLGGATIAVFDLATAQDLLGKRGELDTIFVAARDGVPAGDLVAELDPLVPPTAQIQTGEQQASQNSEEVQEGTQFIQIFLLAFALIALGVGAFVIYNTLSITVAQRIRELATLRALGASRKQVRRSVVLEGFALGVIAAVVGLGLGLLLARGLSAVFVALGIELPKTDAVLKGRTVIVSLLLGVVVTLLASLAPARRATRIAPVAALQEGATLPARLGGRSPVIAGILLAVAIGLLGTGAFGGLEVTTALLVLLGGCILLFVGVSMVSARLVPPLVAAVGTPARRTGGTPGRLAVENAKRNPARTSSTAAALMIGLALVTLVATLGEGLRKSSREALDRTVTADFVLTSRNGFEPIPAEVGEAVARAPGVDAVVPVRQDRGRAFGEGVSVNGVGNGASDLLELRWRDGEDALLDGLGPDGAVVRDTFADDNGLSVGSRFEITTPAGRPLDLVVRGVLSPRSAERLDPVLAKVVVSQEAFDAGFPRPSDQFVFVRGDAAARDGLRDVATGFPDVRSYSKAGWVEERAGGIDTLLNLLYVLLALSVIVSLFGMVNTLVLSVFERTREIGMLRAVGMSRRQVRRMVRQESVITALIGAALGLPLGLLLAALLSQALEDEGVAFAIPVGSLVVFTVVAVIAGVLAAIAPARRAARLDVLKALQYE